MQKLNIKGHLISCVILLCACGFLAAQATVGLLSYDTEQTMEGYNLIYPHNQSTVFLLDNCGRVVKEWTDTDDWVPGNSAYLTEAGNLIKTKRSTVPINDPIWAGGGGQFVEILNWNNQLISQFERNDSLYRLHHDIAPMPNGNILMIVWEYHSFEEAVNAGRDTAKLDAQKQLWSEVIWEWDPVADSIVWEWRVWDHLIQDYDTNKANFGPVANHPELIDLNYDEHNGHPDWLHMNSIDYNPVLDQIIMSVPYFNEVWIIDHSTTSEEAAGNTGGLAGQGGDLLYRYGNPATYRQGSLEDKKLFFQHDAKWTKPNAIMGDSLYGQISVYNNRVGNNLSTMNIWKTLENGTNNYLFENDLFGPNEFDRTVVHPDSIFAAASNGLSSAELLANGNVLILSGRWGYAYEITPDNQVVWEYVVPLKGGNPVAQGTDLGISNNITFRMNRYESSYPGLADRELNPGRFLEINPIIENCPLSVDTENIPLELTELRVFPNPTFGFLNIESTKWLDTTLVIYHINGQIIREESFTGIKKNLDISQLEKGLYIIKIAGEHHKILVH